jgi:C4-type Zn-finger protein
MDEMGSLNMMLSRLEGLKEDDIDEPITMILLDPHGHSMILHPDTVDRELTEEELSELPVGPDPAVFSSEELD